MSDLVVELFEESSEGLVKSRSIGVFHSLEEVKIAAEDVLIVEELEWRESADGVWESEKVQAGELWCWFEAKRN